MSDWSQGVLFHFCGVLAISTTPLVKQHEVLRQLMQPLQGRPGNPASATSHVQMGSCQEGCNSRGKLLKSGSRHVGWVC